MPEPAQRWFTIPEAAEYPGITTRHMREIVWDRRIECVKPGGKPRSRVMLARDVLDRFMEDHAVPVAKPVKKTSRRSTR